MLVVSGYERLVLKDRTLTAGSYRKCIWVQQLPTDHGVEWPSIATANRRHNELKMALLERILSRSNLVRAYDQVVRNRGGSGVDGVEVYDLANYLHNNWLRIKAQIEAGTYCPQPVLGVEIPKPNGGTRLLGIPTVIDRLIQQAIHQVLSPLWEGDFSTFSYGFRPGRNAHQAVLQAQTYINEGYQDTIDLDLKSFFDEVCHDVLVSLLRRKIRDKRLLKLIRRYLQAGLLLDGVITPRPKGTSQGGPLSPLLSNVLLN
jgi:RNA-directed DNA polymerase